MSVGSCTSCGSHGAVKASPPPKVEAPAPAAPPAPVSAAAAPGTGTIVDVRL